MRNFILAIAGTLFTALAPCGAGAEQPQQESRKVIINAEYCGKVQKKWERAGKIRSESRTRGSGSQIVSSQTAAARKIRRDPRWKKSVQTCIKHGLWN